MSVNQLVNKILLAMISVDKIIEIFFIIDEFCKEFEEELSRPLNLGTTPHLGTLPFSFTKSRENRLHTSRILAKFANKLCIW